MQTARPIAAPLASLADHSVELARFVIVTGCALALIIAGQALPF